MDARSVAAEAYKKIATTDSFRSLDLAQCFAYSRAYNEPTMRFLRIFILYFSALLLPVHATAAIAMSVTTKAPCSAEMMQANHPAVMSPDCMHADEDEAPCVDLSCNSCGDCHLASSLVLPPAIFGDDSLPGSDEHGVSPAPTEQSFITTPLPRPPRHC